MSISGRLQAFLLSAFVLACSAYLAVHFWPRDHVKELVGQMPADSAVLAYIDVPGLTEAAVDASLALPWSLGLAANRLHGISLALTGQELHVAAGGDFSASLIDALLASQGIQCGASLGVSPCAANLGHGPVLLSVVSPGVLIATTAASFGVPNAATEINNDEIRAALLGGAVIWAAIDPRLLEVAMEDPPPHWMNLQIVARALERARVAYLTVNPLAGDNVSIRIEAHCDAADRGQLERLLTGLNDMALALLSRGGTASAQWEPILSSFESSQGAETVSVQWTLPVGRLAELWRRAD
ncbi:MAG: hypothetical protein O3A53_03240 [Acidobacteria bacterium]|nr:hypothetical protein [Acidobacteriota bacterium]MDA1233795.1 hypothetical protein [Acidobacteriota bacterium]